MRSARRREVGLAVVLSGVAGYLDAVGFIELRGHFVSFMSGNTTDLATRVGTWHFGGAGLVAGLIGMFVLGVVVGAVAARFGDGRSTVLVTTTALLALTSAVAVVADPVTAVALGLPVAMGAMNAVFLHNGEVSIGLTYMTGTLVKAGQQFVEACTGGPRWLWLRNLSLWLALAAGGLVGAAMHRLVGATAAAWFATAIVLVITVVTIVVRRRTGEYGVRTRRRHEITVIGGTAGSGPVS
ncbi:MAG: YoaK family protein [Gordonia sp. (in: high G+C Gram-positive bacteria)]|uniref:YoaK family protein n=1 Tax=Gordonia TaxID=2053 RepID=UPI0032659560